MSVVGEQGFPSRGVRATHDPVIAAKALANFAFGFQEKFLNGLRQGSGKVRRAFRCQAAGRNTTACFQHGIRLHVVVISSSSESAAERCEPSSITLGSPTTK